MHCDLAFCLKMFLVGVRVQCSIDNHPAADETEDT